MEEKVLAVEDAAYISLEYCRRPVNDSRATGRGVTCDSFILGTPSMETSLYTQPRAGCAWHVTRFVPMPKVSMAWPCTSERCARVEPDNQESEVMSRFMLTPVRPRE